MRKHGLGQQYFEKLKDSQAPLINTLDPGLHTQYWNSEDAKLGLSDFQYAGLETEKMFNPGKYQQDIAIIKQNKGLDSPDGTGKPTEPGKKGYAYDRGVENVLYALENQGRQNTGQFIDQRRAELGPQIDEAVKGYQDALSFATDPAEHQRLLGEFNQHPLITEAAKLDEGQQALDYARTEDQRRFPLNYGDQASRLVKDAMSSTNGVLGTAGVAGKQVLLGAGESADNTARFIKNTFINLLGSGHAKAENAAANIGHQALTELAGYEGSAFSTQEQPLVIDPGLTTGVQNIFNNSSLSDAEKNQRATALVLSSPDQIKLNPKAGQQNLTGKSVIYSAANSVGQILGIADQSLLMGGLLGDAAKAQQMANAITPMYMSTQNQLYEQALARGDDHPLLSSHLDATIISLASLINPDIKVVKGMVGVDTGIGKLIAGVDESTWNKVLSDNKTLVDRAVAGTKATARQLGLANLQYGLIVPTAQYIVHKNVLNEDPNLGDSIKDGMIQASISMAIPALLHGVWGGVDAGKVNPMQKYSIVEAGLHPKENIDLIDQQVEKGQVTPDRAAQIKEVIRQTDHILEHTEAVKSDGSWMNENEVADLAYNMLRKKVLEGKLKNAPDPQKPAIEAKINEIDRAVTDLHTSEADKQKTALNDLLTSNMDKIKANAPEMEGPVLDAIKRNEPEEIYKAIHDEALKTKTVEGKESDSRDEAEEKYGKPLVAKAYELGGKLPAVAEQASEKPQEGAAPKTPAPEPAPQEPAASSFLQSRHADTIHDEEGIVSGPNNKELSPKGRRDANDLAKDVEGKGVTTIITSGLERSKETGERVADKIGAKVENRPELNTWDIKHFDGLTDEEFKDVQKWFVEHPDDITYRGPDEKYQGKQVGESINAYAQRIIPAMEHIESTSGPETLLINHSNNMMLWDAYLKNGREWNDQARQDYLHAEKPEPATLHNQNTTNAIQEPGAGGVLQHPQEGAGSQGGERGGMEPGQQGQAPPGQGGGEGAGQEPPAGAGGTSVAAGDDEETRRVGVSHDELTALAMRLGLKDVERGPVLSPKEYAARGRILLLGGADPEKVARTFERTGSVNPDVISVGRAHLEDLTRAVDKARDTYGEGSEQYKAAHEAADRWVQIVKDMGNKAGQTFTSLQGGRDLDTGSFTSMERKYRELHQEKLTEKQAVKIKELAGTVKDLQGKVSGLEDKLTKAHNQAAQGTPKQYPAAREKAKNLADKLRRNAKLNRPGMFSAATPASLVWDTAVEIVAKGIEAGGLLADVVAKGVQHIQESDWYKGLSDKDKEKAEDQFSDWHMEQADKKTAAHIRALEKQLADLQQDVVKTKGAPREQTEREKELKEQIFDAKDKMGLVPSKAAPATKASEVGEPGAAAKIPQQTLAERMVNKRDNVFSPEDARDVWSHVKENYLDNGTALGDALRGTSTDLGLSPQQILAAIASPKGGKEITMELFKKQNERNKAQEFAKRFVETADQGWAKKIWNSLPSRFFNLKTYGHGTVGNITHAATNIFRPSVWSAYWPNVIKSFGLAYGTTANYEKAITLLESRPNFLDWKKAGLAVDPREGYDEYEVFGKKQSWLGQAGTRGFTGLKLMRYDLAEHWYNQASDTERADPNFRKEIAQLANHATGHSEVKVGKFLKSVTFAPGLEVSRWQRMITDPAKAANTFLHWKQATPAEQAAAKIVASGAGQRLAIYSAALAANAGLLSALGSKQKINTTDPSKSDWLKFKMADKTLDLTGGVLGPLRLLNTVGMGAYKAYFGDKKDLRTKPNDKDAQTLWQQLRYKEAPLAGDITDVVTGQDAMGNTLPWSKVAPGKGRKQLGAVDYAENLLLPIPIAAGFNAYHESMESQGVPASTTKAVWDGALTGLIEGFTGAKYQPDYSLQQQGGSGGGAGAGGRYAKGGARSR
jgi:broad specificity phosphatase PhoE